MDDAVTRGLDAVLDGLEKAGLDDESRGVRCLIDAQADAPAEFAGALRELEALAAGRADAPTDLVAARAKLLIELKREAEALPLLRSLDGRASRYPVRSWLGQALLLTGSFGEALKVLDRAVVDDDKFAWAYFFRAAAKLALGDGDGAGKDAGLFLKKHEGAAAFAMSGLAEAAAGRPERGSALLRRAADAVPSEAWPLVLESVIRRGESDLSGAKDALLAAVARKPSAWLYAELAKTYEHLGILPEAIENAAAAVRLCPCVEHHGLKAHLHGCWRENAEAIAEYGLALRLLPNDPILLFQRSKACSAAARLPEAREDALAAARLSPGDVNLECWAIQLLTLTGRGAEASRRTAALLRGGDPLQKANALFARAYAALCRGARAGALRDLAKCLALSEGTSLHRRADFYRVLASLPPEPKAKKGARWAAPGLYLIGLGVDPPYTATADALRAISRCDVVFNNVMGDEMFEFLRPFCPDARPVAYHQNNDEEKLAAEMLAEVRPGRVVAFVTRGSAIVQGPLGTLLLSRCREKGIAWDCLPAVSSAELLSGKFAGLDGAAPGMAVVDSRGVTDAELSDPSLPLTLFLNMSEPAKDYPALCRRLERQYGGAHPCLILDHVIGQLPLRATVAELPEKISSLSPSAILYLPGKTS